MFYTLRKYYRLYKLFKQLDNITAAVLTPQENINLANLYLDERYKAFIKACNNGVMNMMIKASRDGKTLEDFRGVKYVEEFNKVMQTIVKEKYTSLTNQQNAERQREAARSSLYAQGSED